MKSILRRLAGHFHRESDSSRKEVVLENLEPRMLFSAAPVEAPAEEVENPDAGNEAPAAEVQVDAQSAQAAADALTETETAAEAAPASLPVTGQTSVSTNQGVTLLEVDDTSGQLNQETLEAVAEAAAERWRATGLTADQEAALDAIDYNVDSLANFILGEASGNMITLDDDAGGSGWFIDSTPLDDEEFALGDDGILRSTLGDAGSNHDLLTVLLHEQGHILGIDDHSVTPDPSDVMTGTIGAGLRRLPGEDQADGALPGSIEDTHFAISTLGTPASVAAEQTPSMSYTLADGDDRLLVVMILDEGGFGVTAVSFGSTPLTMLGEVAGSNFQILQVWYKEMGDSLTSTTDTITATFTDNLPNDDYAGVIAAVAYEGVNQTTPVEGFVSSDGTLSTSVTSEVGDLVVGAAYNFGDDLTAGPGQTAIHTHNVIDVSPGSGDANFMTSSEAGAAAVTMSYTAPSLTDAVTMAFNINSDAPPSLDPEIKIEHTPSAVEIPDGDTTPTGVGDEGTYFDSVDTATGMVTRTFTITNTGNADLTLTGATPVSVDDNTHFSVTQPALTTLTPLATTTFTVTFNPNADGLQSTTVHVASDDGDEADYDFLVEGIGTTLSPTNITQLGSEGSISNDGAGFGTTTTLTLPFTVEAGTNRLLVVFGHEKETAADAEITGVTFQSTGGSPTVFPLTGLNLAIEAVDGSGLQQTEIYHLALGSGGQITGNIVMSISDVSGDNDATMLTAVAYENVDQTAPVDGFVSTNGSASNSALNVVSEAGDRVVSVHANRSVGIGAAADPMVDAAQTVIHDLDAVKGASYLVTSTEPGGVLIDTLHSWNSAPEPSQDFVTVAMNINAAPLAPEITIEHTGATPNVEIIDGDTTPSGDATTGEGTDFGSVDTATGMETRIFEIRNDGTSDLTLTGSPVTITGTGASHFSVVQPGTLVLGAGLSTTFSVKFDPTADGVHDATVEVTSDDLDEALYNFDITGEGTTAAGPPATEETGVEVDGGNLVITDVLGGDTDDDLTISTNGTSLTIVDNNGNGIDLGAVTGTGDGTDTVTINLGDSGWTGGIVIDTLLGNDILRVDFGGGANFSRAITFNGGGNGGPGDEMFLIGGGTFASATYDFVDENTGSIDITGNSTISYTGLEPITQAIVADAVQFNYSSASEVIDIRRVGPDTVIDSSAGESVTILSHCLGLTINAGGGDDTINVDGFAPGFDAALIVDGQGDSDIINYRADGISLGTGNSATFTAERIDFLLGDLTTSDGDITATATGGSGGNFIGVRLIGSSLETTDTGNITLTGEGGDIGSSNQGVQLASSSSLLTGGGNIEIDGEGGGTGASNHGVAIFFGSSVSATGGGTLEIDGTSSTSGTTSNHGVFFASGTSATVEDGDMTIAGSGDGTGLSNGINAAGATISSTGSGNISITGFSSGSGSGNQGIILSNSTIGLDPPVNTTGTGSISLNGAGSSNGLSNNEGIRLSNTDLETGGNGFIDIDGLGGGTGGGTNNTGVAFLTGSTAETAGTGALTIDGDAGSGTYFNRGVYATGGIDLSTVDGHLTVRGTGNGTISFNRGVEFVSTTAEATGSGSVTIEGTGSSPGASGLFNTGIYLGSSSVTATTGGITMTGLGGSGSSYNEGIRIQSSTVTTSGVTDILGIANGGTTGLANSGVYIYLNSTVNGGGGSMIVGTGAGGITAFNHGVLMNIGITSNIGTITGTKGGGATSLDRAGNFAFPP